jgi:hypothetical protein
MAGNENIPARTVDEMKEPIKSVVEVNTKDETTKQQLKNEINALYTKRTEKIYWSTDERDKFVGELREQLKGDRKAENILKLIKNEIENELFETKMDESATLEDQKAPDYEDFDDGLLPRDKNTTRDLVEDAWANSIKNLTKNQKDELQTKVLELMKAAAEDGKHEIFKDVEDREGFAFGFGDKMVTTAEATEIAKFITAEAGKMEKQTPTTAAEAIPKTSQQLEKQKTNAESILKQSKPANPTWYDENIAVDETNTIAKKVDDAVGKEFSKYTETLGKLDVTIDVAVLKTTLKKILLSKKRESEKNKEESSMLSGVFDSVGSFFELGQLKDTITKNISDTLKWLPRYKDQKEALQIILKTKNIATNDTKTLVEYFAFGDVEKDRAAAQEYLDAKLTLENKSDEINVKVDNKKIVTKDKNNKVDFNYTKEALKNSFALGMEGFSALMKGNWAEAFEKLFAAWESFSSTFVDAKAGLSQKIKNHLPKSIAGTEMGKGVTDWCDKNVKAKEEKDILTALYPLQEFLDDGSLKVEQITSLKNINISKFIAEPSLNAKYVEDNKISLSLPQLMKLQEKLKAKLTPEEKTSTNDMKSFLIRKINADKEYLK